MSEHEAKRVDGASHGRGPDIAGRYTCDVPYIETRKGYGLISKKPLCPTGRWKIESGPYYRDKMFIQHKGRFFKRWVSEDHIVFAPAKSTEEFFCHREQEFLSYAKYAFPERKVIERLRKQENLKPGAIARYVLQKKENFETVLNECLAVGICPVCSGDIEKIYYNKTNTEYIVCHSCQLQLKEVIHYDDDVYW